MVMFDLSGTTVFDDTGVRDCLYQAVQEHALKTTLEEILLHMGTNKIHLYQYLIAKANGLNNPFRDFEKVQSADTLEGVNAGCRGVVGVLSGPRPVTAWGCYRHTHVIPSVKELSQLIEAEFA